jgi:hypothetical protein
MNLKMKKKTPKVTLVVSSFFGFFMNINLSMDLFVIKTIVFIS